MRLEEYAIRTTENIRTRVVRPTIPNNTNFELKGHILHMLRDIPSNGNEDEDAHNHVDEVLEIADYFKVPGFQEDGIMLRIFNWDGHVGDGKRQVPETVQTTCKDRESEVKD